MTVPENEMHLENTNTKLQRKLFSLPLSQDMEPTGSFSGYISECLDKKADLPFFFPLLTHSFVLAIAYTLILPREKKS